MQNDSTQALMTAISELDSPEKCAQFFADLCTPQELSALSQRWDVAKLLHQGLTTRAVSAQTGASTATISRVNRCIHFGQGYKHLLEKLHPHHCC